MKRRKVLVYFLMDALIFCPSIIAVFYAALSQHDFFPWRGLLDFACGVLMATYVCEFKRNLRMLKNG